MKRYTIKTPHYRMTKDGPDMSSKPFWKKVGSIFFNDAGEPRINIDHLNYPLLLVKSDFDTGSRGPDLKYNIIRQIKKNDGGLVDLWLGEMVIWKNADGEDPNISVTLNHMPGIAIKGYPAKERSFAPKPASDGEQPF